MYVYSYMIQVNAHLASPLAHAGSGFAVRRPRESDAIGHALRNAFAFDQAVPRELIQSLATLDCAR